MPPSMPPILPLICSSIFLTASLHAATIMSCSISTSPATSGSILTASRFFCPSICTETKPPPAVASTLMAAISCCNLSCICCAWRIICCILPGSFTGLLLKIANFSNFAAEDFAETLHFRIGKGAAGGFILAGGRGLGERLRGGAGVADDGLDAHPAAGQVNDGLVEVLFPQGKRIALGRGDL